MHDAFYLGATKWKRESGQKDETHVGSITITHISCIIIFIIISSRGSLYRLRILVMALKRKVGIIIIGRLIDTQFSARSYQLGKKWESLIGSCRYSWNKRGQIKFIFDYNVRAHSVTQYFKRNEKFHPRQDRLNSDETLFLTQSGGVWGNSSVRCWKIWNEFTKVTKCARNCAQLLKL